MNYEILGEIAGDGALVVRIKNIGQVVREKGGAPGGVAHFLAPTTIASKVLEQVRDTLLSEFKKQGVDAQIDITSTPPTGAPPKKEFGTGVVVGVVAAGALGTAGYFAWTRILSRFFGGSK